MAIAFISGYRLSGKTRVRRKSPLKRSKTEAGTHRFIDPRRAAVWKITAVVEALTTADARTLADWLEGTEGGDYKLPVGDTTFIGTLNTDRDIDISPRSREPHLRDVRWEFEGNKDEDALWLLATGMWNDAGAWDDDAQWVDG